MLLVKRKSAYGTYLADGVTAQFVGVCCLNSSDAGMHVLLLVTVLLIVWGRAHWYLADSVTAQLLSGFVIRA